MGDFLSQLTIKGFRSVRELRDFELKRLNILIGGNGAGKSNLIEFFRMLRKITEGSLSEYIRSGCGISDFLFNGRKVTLRQEFEARLGVSGYRFCLRPGQLENCLLTNEALYEHDTACWRELGSSPDGKSLMVKEAKSDSPDGRPVYETISSWQIYHFNDTGATSGMRHYEIIQDNRFLRSDASNIAPYLLRLKKSDADAYHEILCSVRLVIPFFDDFILDVTEFGERQKVSLAWHQNGSDYPMQPYHFSVML